MSTVAPLVRCPYPPPVAPEGRVDRKRQRGRMREPLLVAAVLAAVYFAVALTFEHFNVTFTDQIARVANAYYVLYSRDPHLPAIGFVWNPLPSFVILPLLPLKSMFPALVTHALAGSVQSSVSMATAMALLTSILRGLGVRRSVRLVLVGLCALQPMMLIYGANGESEAMLICWLMLCAAALLSWFQDRGQGRLVVAGLALGLAYLTRYEAAASAAAVVVLVTAMTFRRAAGSTRERAWAAATDAVLVGGPFAVAFAFWASSSKLLVGQWFPTFTSQYGNSAQVDASRAWIESGVGSSVAERLTYSVEQSLVLVPLFLVLLVGALVVAYRRRDVRTVAGLCVFGPVVLFAIASLANGATFGWLRFQITLIPLAMLLAGALLGRARRPLADRGAANGDDGGSPRPARWLTTAVVLAVAVAIPFQFVTLTNPTSNLAREESQQLGSLIFPQKLGSKPEYLQRYTKERDIAAYLDGLDLPDGSVLTDSASAFPIILDSRSPRQFVITSDFDFDASVQDPAAHGIRYLLVPAGKYLDELQQVWLDLYDSGAGIATIVHQWHGNADFGDMAWRLYQVN